MASKQRKLNGKLRHDVYVADALRIMNNNMVRFMGGYSIDERYMERRIEENADEIIEGICKGLDAVANS